MKKRILQIALIFSLVLTLVCTGVFAPQITAAGTPDLTIKGANLTLGDTVYMSFVVPKADGIQLLVRKGSPGAAATTIDPAGTMSVGGVPHSLFSFPIAAKEMSTDIYVQAKVGEDCGSMLKYSVLQYVRNKKTAASPDLNLINVLEKLLEYGAAAQVYFNFYTGRLANADYYEVKVVGGTLSDGTTKGLYLAGETLTINAPATVYTDGVLSFYYWKNSADVRVSNETTYTFDVSAADETYTAVYATKAEICAEEGHDFQFDFIGTVSHIATPATCTAPATYYKVCTCCGEETDEAFAYGDPIEHTFDQMVEEEAYLRTPATCAAFATYYYSCVCGEAGETYFVKELDAGEAHDFSCHVESEDYLVSPATCTAPATYYVSCAVCGQAGSDTFTVGDSLGHDYSEWAATASATCIDGGVEMRVCSRCSEEEERSVDALGHDYGEWIVLTTATCEGSGAKKRVCSRCSDEEESVIYSLGHDISEWAVVTPATCYGEGEKERHCTVCGTSEFDSIAATGHTFSGTWDNDGDYHWHVASCEHSDIISGFEAHTWVTIDSVTGCSICNFSKQSGKPIPKPTLTFTDNGISATVTGVTGTGILRSVNIPETYNGLPVTAIEAGAFQGKLLLKTVILPSSMRYIRSDAFSGCAKLELVKFNDGLSSIGANAFNGCTSLESVTIPSTVTTVGNYAFAECTKLKAVTFTERPTSVGTDVFPPNIESLTLPTAQMIQYFSGSAETLQKFVLTGDAYVSGFSGFTALTTVSLPNGLTQILANTFANCTSLTSISIPESVNSIGANAFEGSGLTSLTLKSAAHIYDNAFRNCADLTSVKMLFTAGGSIGISVFYGCPLTEVVAPANFCTAICRSKTTLTSVVVTGGTSIPANAFDGCTSLASVLLPDSIAGIGGSAFKNCAALTSIRFPADLTAIGQSAFEGTGIPSLTLKNDMSIGSYAFRNCLSLTSVTIEYEAGGSIDTDAFLNCPLTTVVAPAHLCTQICRNKPTLTSVVVTSGTSIPYEAFKGCTNLSSVTLPDTILMINDYAFYNCSALTSIELPDSLTNVGQYAFALASLTDTVLPTGLTIIHRSAFEGSGISSLTLSDTVSIGNYAFRNCSALTSVTLSFTEGGTIGTDAFKNCPIATVVAPAHLCTGICKDKNSLTSVVVTSGTSLSNEAFSGCTKLSSVTLPDTLEIVGPYAFYNCYALTSIELPDTVEMIGERAFAGSYITSIELPDTVEAIDPYAFSNCSYLTSITIPSRVAVIRTCSFMDCTRLTTVTIGEGVTTINAQAFDGCTKITTINIPVGVTEIKHNAFESADDLDVINYGGTMEQWNAVNKEAYWMSTSAHYTVHCIDGDITI